MDEAKARAERIRELIRTYGADFDRWPATEGLGRPVLDVELQKVREEEDTLDMLIAGAPVPDPSAALRRRILNIPDRRPRASVWGGLWILSGFWRPASVAVGALLLGLFLGQITLMQSNAAPVDTDTEMLFADLMLGPAEDLTDFPQ